MFGRNERRQACNDSLFPGLSPRAFTLLPDPRCQTNATARIMAEAPVLIEYKSNGVAVITLNQPKKLNALNQDGYYQLAVALHQVAKRDDIYITVLTGKGRFFSAQVMPPSTYPVTYRLTVNIAAPTSPSAPRLHQTPTTATRAVNGSRASSPTIYTSPTPSTPTLKSSLPLSMAPSSACPPPSLPSPTSFTLPHMPSCSHPSVPWASLPRGTRPWASSAASALARRTRLSS